VATVTLTAAQIKALASGTYDGGFVPIFSQGTPIELVAAPGIGKAIIPQQVVLQYKFSTTPIDGGGYLVVDYDGATLGDSGTNLFNTQSNFVTYLVSSSRLTFGPTVPLSSGIPKAMDQTALANKALTLFLSQGSFLAGPIGESTLHAGGSGYAQGDTGFIDNGGSLDAAYVIDTVDESGAVLTYHLTASGCGYFTGINDTYSYGAQPGIGTGFQITIDSITPTGDGTLTVTVYYTVIDLN
jgi:hypothetical protein